MKLLPFLLCSTLLADNSAIQWGVITQKLQCGVSVSGTPLSFDSPYKATVYIVNKSSKSIQIMRPRYRGYWSYEYKGVDYDRYTFSIRDGKLKKGKRTAKDLITIAAGDTVHFSFSDKLHLPIEEDNKVQWFYPEAGTYAIRVTLQINKNNKSGFSLRSGWAPIETTGPYRTTVHPHLQK